MENIIQNPIVPTFSLFRYRIFCCFLVTQSWQCQIPIFGQVSERFVKSSVENVFGLHGEFLETILKSFLLPDGTVVCDQRTKKLLIPKVTNEQTITTTMATDAKHIISFSVFSPPDDLLIFLSLDYFSEDTEERDSTALIILFPVLAGGLLLTLTAAVFIRKLMKKRHEWKPEGLLSYHP